MRTWATELGSIFSGVGIVLTRGGSAGRVEGRVEVLFEAREASFNRRERPTERFQLCGELVGPVLGEGEGLFESVEALGGRVAHVDLVALCVRARRA